MKYIPRLISSAIDKAKPFYNVIVVTGPRQVGKTTLCRHHFPDYRYYNLEDLSLREAVATDPKGFLAEAPDRLIIDEVQHLPLLLSYIQFEVDSNPERRFVLTGSSNLNLLENVTQSLAGRAALFTLLPFSIAEVRETITGISTDQLLINGFYPAVLSKGTPPELFFQNYYSTYVERDVRQLRAVGDLMSFQAFMRIMAGRAGSEFNASSIATELGVTAPTVKAWLSVLNTSYITFPLRPYFANISKRLTKSPKIFFYDTGLLCYLLGISSDSQLSVHPLRGCVFENLAVVELMKQQFNTNKRNDIYFYRENKGREVDVLLDTAGKFNLYEIKSSMTFHKDFTRNMDYLANLLTDKVVSRKVIYDGDDIPPIAVNVRSL